MPHNVGGMASKGLRAISYQGTRKVEAGYNPSHTTETLIGYTACYAKLFFYSEYNIFCRIRFPRRNSEFAIFITKLHNRRNKSIVITDRFC